MTDFKTFLTDCMTEASSIAMQHFGNVTVKVKEGDNNQVLTAADLEIGAYLVGQSQACFPKYNIIDEEAGVIDQSSVYTIVIDPIDGTSNFANGLPLFGIFMGILHEGTPVAGAIALPAFGDMYVAEKGKGAWRNGEKVHVALPTELQNSLIAYGIDGHQENPAITHQETALLGEIVLAIRNLRSSNSAFDVAAVADGRYSALLNRTTKIWDNVAAQIVIEEAGGVCTDFWGHPLDFTNPLKRIEENFTICAGSSVTHAALQKIIHAHES